MKVLVLGSGVVGTSSAYYLARAGHEVIVVDRQAAAGMETSFANAGQVTPGCSGPWAAPGIPLKAIKWLAMRYRPFVIRPLPDPRLAWWLAQMLANCTETAYRTNKARILCLTDYSLKSLQALREDTGITYDARAGGVLEICRTQAQLDHLASEAPLLDELGVAYDILDRAACVEVEPALGRVPDRIVGGIRFPGDESGDAHMFTQALAARAAQDGVVFRHGVRIAALETSGEQITGVVTDAGTLTADRYVVALGSYAPALVRQLRISLPVYPVKGYSITAPIRRPEAAPIASVTDETYKIVITRLGERIRVGGTAELAGFSTRLRTPRRAALEHSLRDLFPDASDPAEASFWTGLRPMTPDGTPVVGPTRYRNLFLNTGHGTLGWTMACGSGRLLADLISGRQPDIASADLSIERYRAAQDTNEVPSRHRAGAAANKERR